MAQSAEHILGKDEVPGSNPGNSSNNVLKNPYRILFLLLFFFLLKYTQLRDKYDYFLSVFLHILVYKPGRLFIFRHFLIVFVKWHVFFPP